MVIGQPGLMATVPVAAGLELFAGAADVEPRRPAARALLEADVAEVADRETDFPGLALAGALHRVGIDVCRVGRERCGRAPEQGHEDTDTDHPERARAYPTDDHSSPP